MALRTERSLDMPQPSEFFTDENIECDDTCVWDASKSTIMGLEGERYQSRAFC